VFYPARSGRPGLAALVYAVAGWTGSALGIGLAQELDRVPAGLIAASGVVLAAMFFVRHRDRRRPAAPVQSNGGD
jgi:cytochrome c oxidase cbb3-type subunit 2